jgi:hypothetical protein
VLIGGALFVYRLLALVLGSSDAGNGAPLVDMGRAMSVILVAAGIGLYHWRALRADSAARPITSPQPLTGDAVQVDIKGATEAQIRRALTDLPDGASYTIKR